MTETPKITIPDEAKQQIVKAWQAAAEAWENVPFGAQSTRSFIAKSAEDAVQAAAPLIVAAELERLAAAFGTFNRTRLRSMGLDKESVDIPAQNMELARVRDLLSSRAADLRGVSGVSADGGEKQS